MTIYTIPAGAAFAQALAAELLRRADGKPETLTQMRVFLPTRRACRVVRDAFLRESAGVPLLLPQLQPLGDIDEEELALAGFAGDAQALLKLPPAMPPLQRQILLARAIMARKDFRRRPEHAMALAEALGRLMDRIYTEERDVARLPDLAGKDFAAHWQITLGFLETLTHEWPGILTTLGMIDLAQRRRLLLDALAAHWEQRPPSTPVIAAGSTGTIPATARLMKIIARLPAGDIVLPGLDCGMDEESWDALDDTHPQAALRKLLFGLETDRSEVKCWPGTETGRDARAWLATETMRPAATAHEWAQIRLDEGNKTTLEDELRNITRFDAATPQEEARLIGALMREILETPGRTAALVTPDRALARRVAMICRRWNIEIDDSAGLKLGDTSIGIFLRLSASAFVKKMAPHALLALLRHRLCNLSLPHETLEAATGALEISALRGPKPPPGIEGLRNRLAQEQGPVAASDLLDRLAEAVAPLEALENNKEPRIFSAWLDAHITVAENLAALPEKAGAELLWSGEDGEAAALFLAELRGYAAALPETDGEGYLALLEQLMAAVTVRPRFGMHPRLIILGQMEARLMQADLVILAGLNEGTWPPDPGHDPWMSRPMLAAFGLPGPERAVGLAAHDFVQGFCAPRVVLTRSLRDGGTPTVPARWLQRLDTVLKAAGLDPSVLTAPGLPLIDLVRRMDFAPTIKAVTRPAPRPPRDRRPNRLSVTQIETWLRDPYGIYARHVLKLKKLKPLEQPPDAADKGELLHGILDEFFKTTKEGLPENAQNILLDRGRDALTRRSDDTGFWDFWWPRFERVSAWVVENERVWRGRATPLITEGKGEIAFDAVPGRPFVLTARADRIDRLHDGTLAAIDYKSGGTYTAGKIKSGEQPQLPLEALILQQGGFPGIPPAPVTHLSYWLLTGGTKPGSIEAVDGNLDDLIRQAEDGLRALIQLYDNENTPYFSLPDPARAPRFNDYAHLARVQEWAALDENTEAA